MDDLLTLEQFINRFEDLLNEYYLAYLDSTGLDAELGFETFCSELHREFEQKNKKLN